MPPPASVRIAHLVIGGEVAGGQLVALQLARAARAAGHDALFVAPDQGAFTRLAEAEGFRVRLAALRRTFDLLAAWRLARLLRAERVDILHTHTHLAGNVLGRIAGRVAGARVITHAHIEGVFNRRPAIARAQRALERLTSPLSSRIVAVSESTRQALIRAGIPDRTVVTIPNGVELRPPAGSRERIRAELGIPSDATVVGSVGRLCDVKGQRELLDAVAGLPGLWVALVGVDLEQGGAYEDLLRRRARDLGLADRTVFTGYREDVPALLEALDVFVLPSWIEGMPLVVLEAMAASLPVVATPVGGTPELVSDGETGYLVPVREPAALEEALTRLTADPELARRFGAAGRERVERNFSLEASTRRVLSLYAEATR